MNHYASLSLSIPSDTTLNLSGVMDEMTVLSVYQQGCNAINKAPKQAILRVDLKEVASADSAGLALLLEWARYAKKQNKLLRLFHPPEKFRGMLVISGLDNVLQLDGEE